LADLSFTARIDEPKLVGMGMDVNESRREREAVAGHAFVRVAIGEIPDRDDSAVGDGDVGDVRRCAESVVDPGALEDRPKQRLT
jgi:hypothetical protein